MLTVPQIVSFVATVESVVYGQNREAVGVVTVERTALGDESGQASSSGRVQFGYRGELELADAEYLRSRDLSLALRTFRTLDPLSGIVGTPVQGNGYHCDNNEPVSQRDPLGLRPNDLSLGASSLTGVTFEILERQGADFSAAAGVALAEVFGGYADDVHPSDINVDIRMSFDEFVVGEYPAGSFVSVPTGERTNVVIVMTSKPASYAALSRHLSRTVGAVGTATTAYEVGDAVLRGYEQYERDGGSLTNSVLNEAGNPIARAAGSAAGASLFAGACTGSVIGVPLSPGCAFVGSIVGDQVADAAWEPIIQPVFFSGPNGCFVASTECILQQPLNELNGALRNWFDPARWAYGS